MQYTFVAEKPKATVIIPTIGNPHLKQAVEFCLSQTYENTHVLVVVDGPEYYRKVMDLLIGSSFPPNRVVVSVTPENTGGKGYYGHRIFATYPLLIDSDYYLFLDEDNWFAPNHIESLMGVMTIKDNLFDFAFSFRNICDEKGDFICKDQCESLGHWPIFFSHHDPQFLVDTSSFIFRKDFIQNNAYLWSYGWGGDRRFFYAVKGNHLYGTSKQYTLNYRLGGNEGSVKKEFFIEGNKKQLEHYMGELPWEI